MKKVCGIGASGLCLSCFNRKVNLIACIHAALYSVLRYSFEMCKKDEQNEYVYKKIPVSHTKV